jgi:hypothetical protein
MLDASPVGGESSGSSVPECEQRRGAKLIRIWTPYVLVALGTLLYLRPFTRVLWHNMDEGIVLDGAQRVTEGQLPGRDFLEGWGPGGFYWLAALFRLFGTSVVTAGGLLLATGVVVALAVFHLARRVDAHAALCAALFVVTAIATFPIHNHHLDSETFCLLALCAFVEWQRSGNVYLLAGCGALAAAATVTYQSQGPLFLAALVLSSLLVSRRAGERVLIPILVLMGTYLTLLASVAAFYFSRGALHDLFWANFIWPATRALGMNSCPYAMFLGHSLGAIRGGLAATMPGSLSLAAAAFVGLPLLIAVALPVLVLGLAAMLGVRAFTSNLTPFWCCGIALWLSELERPDTGHLIFGSAILLILVSALLRRQTTHPGIALLCSASLLFFAGIYLSQALGAQVPIETRRGRLFGQSQDQALLFLLRNTHPGDYVFIYPYSPEYYFLSDTRNPTRLSHFVYGWNPPEQFREAVARLEAKQVRFVLWDPGVDHLLHIVLPTYKTAPVNEQIIEPYLESHYHQLESASGFRIMERNR